MKLGLLCCLKIEKLRHKPVSHLFALVTQVTGEHWVNKWTKMYVGGGWQTSPCSSAQGQAPGSHLKPPIPLPPPPPQLPVPPFTLILEAAATCPCPDKSYLWALDV